MPGGSTMGRRLLALGGVGLLLATLLPASVSAAPRDGKSKLVPKAPDGVYIVRLVEAPAAVYEGDIAGFPATAPRNGAKYDSSTDAARRYTAELARRHDAVLGRVGAAGRKIYSYTTSFNGFAATLTLAEARALAALPEVAAIEPDRLQRKATDNSSRFLGLTDPDGGLRADLGLDGEDIVIGVIDTGIWPEHPSFSDQADLADRPGSSGKRLRVYDDPPRSWHGACHGGEGWSSDDCNNKLIGARYFLRGFEMHDVVKVDYRSARDADGHGTHTASTAAGNALVPASIYGVSRGLVSGIAPRARVAAYKAIWNDEGGFTSDLVAAIDAAVADGVDVINYSIGSDTPGFTGADDIAFLIANASGVFVATSAGNAGPGASTIGSPSADPWVLTVGASTQDRTFQGGVTLGNGVTYHGASVTNGTATRPIVDAADAGSELCEIGRLDAVAVAGKIVLCLRGGNARVDKSRAVQVAGGVGMVLYNPTDAQALVTDNHWVPSVHVTYTDGLAIKAYIETAGAGATASIEPGTTAPAAGSVMADFSSRGENGADANVLKPDITAPGVNILAGNTPTPFLGSPGQLFQSISGTSMSSPHMAGLAALLIEAHPTWTPDQVKSAFMLTARQDVLKEDGTTPAGAFDYGAGHVVPNDAVDPGVTMSVGFRGYVRYLCREAAFLVSPATCTAIGSQSGTDINLPSIAIGQLVGSQSVSRTFRSVATGSVTWTPSVEGLAGIDVSLPAPVTITAGDEVTWTVTFTQDDAALGAWVDGAIVWAAGDGSGRRVRVPVVVRPRQLAFPSVVTGTATGAATTLNWDVKSGYAGDLSADGFGLAADDVLAAQVVSQDPDQDIETDPFASGVRVYDFTLGANARYVAMGTLDATTTPGSDLDVFLLHDVAGDGFTLGDLVALSADGDSNEIVELVDPAPGDYRLIVHGWATPGGSSTFDLHRWTVDQATGDAASLVATAGGGDPETVGIDEFVAIEAAASNLAAPGQYRGVVTYRDGSGAIGTTVVIIDR